MRCSLNAVVTAIALIPLCVTAALAQTRSYNIGRIATPEEIRAWDISIGPDGKGLPPGSGTAKEGATLYAQKCAACHGATGVEAPAGPRLVGDRATLTTLNPQRTVGSYWPFATQIWDFINRAMPPNFNNRPVPPNQKLKVDEVYALTAFLLYKNGIIKEGDVIDAASLPKVQMPNRNGFVPPRFEDIPDYRGKRACRSGTCP
jgi:S-disulfanyl-L-cysteine oxidoreductase SoxD